MQEEQLAPLALLSETEFDQLADLVSQFEEEQQEDSFFFILGYITAQACSPKPCPPELWQANLLDTPLAEETQQPLQQLLQLAYQNAAQGFAQGAGIELPFACNWDEENADYIADWCAGFLQTTFEQEELWLEPQELNMAELLLPIMALSGLFSEEEDFAEIEASPELLQAFTSQLPELLLDIYCQLNAPEEKTSKPAKPASNPKHKKRRRK